MRNLTNRRFHNQRGSILVEFVIASNVFLMTMFGMIEFTRAVWEHNVVTNVAREGARWATVRGSTSAAPTSSPNATAAHIKAYVEQRAYGDSYELGCAASVAHPRCVNVSWPDGSNAPGKVVQVNVQKRFLPLSAFLPQAAILLQSTAQMVITK